MPIFALSENIGYVAHMTFTDISQDSSLLSGSRMPAGRGLRPRILVIDNRDSFVFNLVQLLRESGRRPSVEVVSCDCLEGLHPEDFDGVLISPGPGIPSEAGSMTGFLSSCIGARVPVLGVCLGFQAIAEHFGGTISPMPHPRHGHLSRLHITFPGDPVLKGVPEGTAVGRYHSWKADPDNLPEELRVTSIDEDGNIMSISHRSLPVYGFQFHPESFITGCGKLMTDNWLSLTRH